jgi:hypothetical protein
MPMFKLGLGVKINDQCGQIFAAWRPGVNLDAHNSFRNKGEAQIWRSDIFELEVDRNLKKIAKSEVLNVNFQLSRCSESHRPTYCANRLGVANILQ